MKYSEKSDKKSKEKKVKIVKIQNQTIFVIFKFCIKGCENLKRKSCVYFFRHLHYNMDQQNFGTILKHGNVQSMFEIEL